jgi:outer membrane protein W
MKLKYQIVLLLLTAKVFLSKAQNVSLGLTAGYNASSTSDNSNAKPLSAYNGGLFFNYSTKTNFGFNGSAIYTQLGNRAKNNSSNFLKINYLQIPINVIYFLGQGLKPGTVRPKIFAGPYLGYLLHAESPGFSPQEVKDFHNEIDYGINIGAGLNYALYYKRWINLDVKYGIGLGQPSKVTDNRFRTLSVNLGISFPLGSYNTRTGTLDI